MKKLPAFLNTPARVVIVVGLIILMGEFLIMLLIESIHTTAMESGFLGNVAWKFVDPIMLAAFVAPALYLLIFRALNQQAELERQLDELRRFQKLTVGRELRMKELAEENTALRSQLSAGPDGDIPVTSGSLEAAPQRVTAQSAAQSIEEMQLDTLLFMLEDLERSRHQVEQAHREWMSAMDVVDDPIFLHDKEFRILRCNKAYQQRAGIPFNELIGQLYYEVFPKTGGPLSSCLHALDNEEEEEEMTVGETIYRSRAFSVKDEQGAYLNSVHTLEDITESRRAEAALHESEEKFRKISESAQDAIMMMGADRCISFWNAAAERIFGYTAAEALGQELHALIVPELAHAKFTQAFPHFQASGEGPIIGKVVEVIALRKGGEEFPAELSVSATQFGGQWHAIGIVRDITERKRAEEKLRESEKLYRSLFENMLNGFAYCQMIFEQDQPQDFIYLSVNAAFETLTGLKNVAGKKVSEVIPGIRQSDPGLFEIYGRASLSGKPERLEIYVEALQQWFWISVYSPGKGYFVAVFDVITERKAAEAAIQHANRAFATLSAVNRSLVYATDENELLQAICQVIVEQRGYRLAWVGYKQHDESKSIKIMASAGHDEGYLDALRITWAETERGMGPAGRAARNGTTQLCQDIASDQDYSPWRDAALKQGYAANIALPLLNGDNTVFGVLAVYAGEVNAFTPAEIALLEEMAGDMAFGVRSLRMRQERDLALVKNQEQLVQLEDSLEDTVRTIATIVEMRDPYTSGHQVRVADLASAIAMQMGLPDEQVHAIHLAGIVHDLGKIQIPAEILSKPGKITDIEFSLIKIHPQAGYDILKDIDFPWPIAQMVLQHHERMDGSGYPQGLKGEDILLEARILAVADVVEAIAAHRPYRPGLGIEVAMEEITKNRGKFYDPQVVDACLTLFSEQGYTFK